METLCGKTGKKARKRARLTIRIPKRRSRNHRPKEGPFSFWSLLQLSLFSGFIFVFSALLIQFFLSLWTMLLLRHVGITFQYSLFHIIFFSYSSTPWSEELIYLVFASGPLLLTTTGGILLFVLNHLDMAGWKTKLIFTWLSFLLIHTLPCSILAGTVFFDGFGMAYFWLVNSFVIRGILALIVLAIMIVFSRFWFRLFLKTAYTKAFFDGSEAQKTFFRSVFLKPWFFGFLMLLGFNWPFHSWFWPASLLCLGYLAILLADRMEINPKPRIKKSDKQIFTNRFQLLLFTILLVLIWAAGLIRVNF